MRSGAEYFTQPAGRRSAATRRCARTSWRAAAAEVADRFGYSTASVHQMASLLRTGKLSLFAEPSRARRGRARPPACCARVLALRRRRALGHEIAAALTAEGTPVSAQTVWQILDAEGLRPAAPPRRGPPRPPGAAGAGQGRRDCPAGRRPVTAAVRSRRAVAAVAGDGASSACPSWSARRGYPSTRLLSAWHSLGTLLLAKCARNARVHHIDALADDPGLALAGADRAAQGHPPGQLLLPRAPRANEKLLTGLVGALRELGLATGEEGFNLDFHAIRHHGDRRRRWRSTTCPAARNAPARCSPSSPRTTPHRDGLRQRRPDQGRTGREIIAFADYWHNVTGADPGLLVFDSQLTTYKMLDELTARGIRWLTLRERGKPSSPASPRCPASVEDRHHRPLRPLPRPRLHDEMIKIKGISARPPARRRATSAATNPPC